MARLNFKLLLKKYPFITLVLCIVIILAYWFCLPRPLFNTPQSFVLESSEGSLLGARISKDGQWRFPPIDSVPDKFASALITFEDHRFYHHPGVDPIGLARALWQNIKNRKIVSGGSTISMQVIRMAGGNPPRTIWRKLLEMIQATRFELGYSKKDILKLYASHAPFGGNIVGLEAASWRYYGKPPHLLSWAEACMMAVLPNSPGLIHPGRSRDALLQKRNRLLDKLLEQAILDSLTYELAMEEPLPEAPLPLPQLAPHLLDRAYLEYTDKPRNARINTSIQLPLQKQLNSVLAHHQKRLSGNQIHNLAAVIIDVESGQVLAYAGNVPEAGSRHANQVDIITAPRSTGSILKPFLYARCLQEGLISPQSILADVPTQMGGYRPENFHEDYDGMVRADRALIRSLNVPVVRLLSQYGLEKFHYHLQKIGLTTISHPASHYGLPLVLGGAEANLWDITNAYACMARVLKHYHPYNSQYDKWDIHPASYTPYQRPSAHLQNTPPGFGASAIWFTFEAMQEVERPNSEGEWENFESRRRIAWKTGTSFGFRDAWAIGVNPKYAVGVWAGNADGEGRPGLIGIKAAAPVLFDIFNRLPGENEWFEPPYDDMIELSVCQKSAYRPSPNCPTDTIWAPASSINADVCKFHHTVYLDQSQQWRVNAQCESPGNMIKTAFFSLPPVAEHYYRKKHPDYYTIPPFRSDCDPTTAANSMQLIYPKYPTKIYVPVDLNGQLSKTVFKVAHRSNELAIYWHIDETYIGTTREFHSMEFAPSVGKHVLTLVDEQGQRLVQEFEIIGK